MALLVIVAAEGCEKGKEKTAAEDLRRTAGRMPGQRK